MCQTGESFSFDSGRQLKVEQKDEPVVLLWTIDR